VTTTYFHGGTVWCGPGRTFDALLVRDGLVIGVGDEADPTGILDLERVDLAGGFVMPAFGDGHAHPLFGGLESEGPRVRPCTSVAEIVAEVRRYADEHPEAEWIFGASYDGSLSEGGLFDARWLDEAVPDRPVVLRAWDYHTVWVNTRALEVAGITAATPDPVLGEITRRADGSPLGTLREWGAVDLVMNVAPTRPSAERMRALATAGEYYLSRGVTWVQDAWVEPGDVETYVESAEAGVLPMRVNLALYADPRHFAAQLPDLIRARDRVEGLRHPLLTAHTVKFFADGVIENETGALLEPYCSALHKHGLQVWGAGSELADAVTAVDAAGFQVHIHAIGDAAVRQALDAIARATATNGPRDRRPVIAHAQLIDGADVARFAALGVVACMQPLWAQLDALMTVLTMPRLGPERTERQYQLHSLAESGTVLAFGSDWPCSSGDPREGIAIAVSRQTLEDGEPAGGWTPDELIGMDDALHAYSTATAWQAFADRGEAAWGTLSPGATADLVVLARDPREVAARELPHVQVVATYLAGERRFVSSA
jgi:predicted amidohydrolase YtcJ